MHTMWKGSISFGLVNIPIKMFTATEDKTVKFRYLHGACKTPIQYSKRCPQCDVEVEMKDIVKGYEYESGRYVVINDEELEEIKENQTRAIEILNFVSLEEIDPIYYEKSYFLAPEETGKKAYRLLREAMLQSGKIAIAKITIRSKQSLAAVRIYKNSIMLETIYYPDEVRDVLQVPGLERLEGELNEKEIEMATQLISNLSVPFDPAQYQDEYRQNVMDYIQNKIAGEEIHISAEPPKANIIDLMDALKASVEATKNTKGKTKSRSRKKTATVS